MIMKIAMVRVGIDAGSGGIQGPLFQDGTFEYIPIPDGFGFDERTYGNTIGRHGKKLADYFPVKRRAAIANTSIHFDPEFLTFTYGDPTTPKAGLRHLSNGDMLIFYCGLAGWDFESPPALYLLGYFEVLVAGKVHYLTPSELETLFSNNYHVKYTEVFERQKKDLVLVKGSENSRILNKAIRISEIGWNRSGKPIKVLSSEMQKIFGDFNGKLCIQRSPTRWIREENVGRTVEYIRSL
jgi:hypothetical protein